MQKSAVYAISFVLISVILINLSSCRKTQQDSAIEQEKSSILIPSQTAKDVGDWSLNQVYLPGDQGSDDPMRIRDLVQNEHIQVILLHFWASWDQPADALMPLYESLYQQYLDKGLLVLGICVDEKSDTLLDKIQDRMLQNQLSYPILWDHDSSVKNSYNIGAIPVTYLIDKQGKIRYEHSGFTSKEVDMPPLEEAINALLKK
jgi:thiol-disulfide isomerase/thioredoxin